MNKVSKKGLLMLAVTACMGVSMSVMADVNYMVKSDNASELESIPYSVEVKPIGGSYVRVTASDEDASNVEFYLTQQGFDVEQDVQFSRAPTDPSREIIVSEQSQTFNDPRQGSQASLLNTYNDLLEGMESQRLRQGEVDVLFMDTGSLPHEDVVFQGGYNYSTMFDQTEGVDYIDFTNVEGVGTCTSGHGLAMAAISAASQNNGRGITGIANANIYMSRVMSTDCNTGEDVGQLSDLLNALSDLGDGSNSGIPVPDVINISLAARTPCPSFLQQGINDLVDQGVAFVVSAGNQGDLAAAYAPANCQNVIVAGAHDDSGSPSAFSNQGDQVDVTVMGEHFTALENNQYGSETGTSGASAALSGVVLVLKQSFPTMTPSQIEYVIKETVTPYSGSVSCDSGCGEGMANLNDALRFAEKIIDPQITFTHAMETDGQCQATREIEALSSHINVCNAYIGHVAVNFADASVPVDYSVSLIRREAGDTSWTDGSAETLYRYAPGENRDSVPIIDVTDEHEYALVACDGDVCPYVNVLDTSSVDRPSQCQ